MKNRYWLCLLLLFACFGPTGVYAFDTITILHVNDFHGRIFPYLDKTVDDSNPVGGAAYLAEMIRKEREKNPSGTVLLSGGDMFQGTPISNIYSGRPVLDFMNIVGFDAITLGNHEFDWGFEVLDAIVRDARFSVLCANIQDTKGQYLPGIWPYVLVERKGYKIGIIGLTTPSIIHMINAKYARNLRVLQSEAIISGLIEEVKRKGAEVVVLLTHLGFDVDQQMAPSLRGADVVVGGHSHTAVTEAVKVGDVLVAQAGYNGIYLGIVTMKLERNSGRAEIVEKKGALKRVIAGPNAALDKAVDRMAQNYGEKIKTKFQEVVGDTKVDLTRQSDGASIMGNIITDAMREATEADVALHNSGGIRADIPKGKITMEQVFTVLPFDNVLVTMDLRGSDLLALFETGSGVGRGMLQLSGARVSYDLTKPLGQRVVRAEVKGILLDKSKTYRVTTNDFLAAGGDKFSAFNRGSNVHQGEELRDVFLAYVRRHSPLTFESGDRILVKGP
jgi:5'-nucleotidase / UDP-sugar diphosphatase